MLNWSMLASPYNWFTVTVMGLFLLVLLATISPQSQS
jgi:hypothetical protein